MESVKLGMDQKLVEGQEKLHQMWLNWNQKQLQGTEKSLAKPEVSIVGRGMGAWGPDLPLHPRLMDQPA
ncbi:Perilipin-3 [Myotis brandtii]|uniref:Perilipin-3 n=1 Tax=Myotis brandtii TaxID=109478 RepID=S7NMZ7_MYOBR|nr:Perilipin-3 [Myotis brandtii]